MKGLLHLFVFSPSSYSNHYECDYCITCIYLCWEIMHSSVGRSSTKLGAKTGDNCLAVILTDTV